MQKLLIATIISLLSNAVWSFDAEKLIESKTWVKKMLSPRAELGEPAYTDKDIKDSLKKYDFAPIFTHIDNSFVFGVIGNNMQRLRVHLDKVKKNSPSSNIYEVVGQSKVRNNLCRFTGTITISTARKWANNKILDGILDRDEQVASSIAMRGIAAGDYEFREDPAQKNSGIFRGKFTTLFYVDKSSGSLHYDDLNSYSDSYLNNAFVGVWTDYKEKTTKRARWGDWRVPNSEDLDIGAGEFYPADKYRSNGWELSTGNESKWWQ